VRRSLSIFHEAVTAQEVPPICAEGEVLTWHADAWSELNAAGYACVSPAAAGAGAERRAAALARGACSYFFNHAAVTESGFNLLHLIALRHQCWIHRAAWVRTVNECVLRARRINRLMLPRADAERRPHLLDLKPGESAMPAMQCLAASAAQRLGIEVIRLPEPATSCALPVRSAAHPAHGGGSVCPEGHVLLIGDAVDHPWRRQINQCIGAKRKSRMVVVTHDRAACAANGSVDYPAPMHQDDYAGPLQPVTLPGAESALDRFIAGCREDGSQCASFFLDAGLQTHLAFLFSAYAHAVAANLRRWMRAMDMHRPAAVLAAYPCMAIEAAHAMGIPALLLPHASLMTGATGFYTRVPSRVRIGATGPKHAQMLARQGIGPERIVLTGGGAAPAAPPLSSSESGDAAGRPAGEVVRLLLPVTGPVCPARISRLPVSHFCAEARIVRALIAASSRRQWHIDIRMHPRFGSSAAFYRRLCSPHDAVEVTDGSHESLESALHHAHAVVCIGGPSSVMLEAAASGRPVLIVEESLPKGTIAAWGLEDFMIVPDVAMLVREVEHLVRDPAAFARAAAAAQRAADAIMSRDPSVLSQAIESLIIRDGASVAAPIYRGLHPNRSMSGQRTGSS